MALSSQCIFRRGESPIIATAIHDGHDMRPSVERHCVLSEEERLREEDPGTGEWTQIAKTQIVALRSRFEVDLNRPREQAVYQTPAESWGLKVWDAPLDPAMIQASLKEYDEFYTQVERVLQELIAEHGRIVIYDLHTYNYRRAGENEAPAPPQENPEVNVGTGTMDREYWSSIVDRFVSNLRAYDFLGRHLDVRENVKFQGGYFPRWVHQTFPEQACCIAIEIKKFFMDEFSGEIYMKDVEAIYRALRSTLRGVRNELERR